MNIRRMRIDDYEAVMKLWNGAEGVGVGPDDGKESIENYLQRNPKTSFVAEENGIIIGAIMAGHDGYRGFIHHTAVDRRYRKQGIGRQLVEAAMQAIKADGIHKVVLVVFKINEYGNAFWEKLGFDSRDDLYYRNLRI